MRYIVTAFVIFVVMVLVIIFNGALMAQPDPIGVPWDPSEPDPGPVKGIIDINLDAPWQWHDANTSLTIGGILITLGVPWYHSDDMPPKPKVRLGY